MNRNEALRILELEDGDSATEAEIAKKYKRLALKRHPDKPGGSKEAFQDLVNAYEFLKENKRDEGDRGGGKRKRKAPDPQPQHYNDCNNQNHEWEDEEWYSFHFNFFSRGGFYDSHFHDDDDDRWEAAFGQQRETARRRYERQRRENLRNNYDYRDRQGGGTFGGVLCSFCGVNDAIQEREAMDSGVNWEEYEAHPESYRTCWNCKNKHISVMTESKATKQFAKKLEPMNEGPYGSYRQLFWILRKEGRAFHHQPKTKFFDGPARNSCYYWYPDLEDAALARGWKPRGKKKEEVPWRRKDYTNAIVLATPTKKKKGAAKVTPEKF